MAGPYTELPRIIKKRSNAYLCNLVGQGRAENGFYMSINILSRNLGTIFFAAISKVCSIQ